jgi:hypothetical protein
VPLRGGGKLEEIRTAPLPKTEVAGCAVDQEITRIQTAHCFAKQHFDLRQRGDRRASAGVSDAIVGTTLSTQVVSPALPDFVEAKICRIHDHMIPIQATCTAPAATCG